METIGRLRLSGKAWLAPMAAVSDVAFRALCKRYGAAATPTEFLSANALARAEPRVVEQTATAEEEDVKIIQIFGQNAANIAKATQWITAQDRFDCIDMNLGCPSPKVLAQGAGSALLRRPDKIPEVVNAIIDNTHLPVSLKIRMGMRSDCLVGEEIIQYAQDAGINHVAIHARTVKQGYGGKADWDYIKQCVERFDIPIIANGDITNGSTAQQCLDHTNACAVMIGRAARANPFVFADVNATLLGKQHVPPTPQQRAQTFFEYLDLYKKYNVNDWSALKSHAMQFTRGLQGGARVRESIVRAKTIDEVSTCLRASLSE